MPLIQVVKANPATPLPQALQPARADLAGHAGACGVLHATLEAIRSQLAGGTPAVIDLARVAAAERDLIGSALGEGEVAARIEGDDGLQAQESVFAGVWRVLHFRGSRAVRDTIEVGPIPAAIPEAARRAALRSPALPAMPVPDAMQAAWLRDELCDRQRRWKPGGPAQVINLTLLPLTPADRACLDAEIGRGPVTILSRGYADCRIVSTRMPQTWRVSYFDAQGRALLDTLEVAAVPEVAYAAREDLEDSAIRLAELLRWAEST